MTHLNLALLGHIPHLAASLTLFLGVSCAIHPEPCRTLPDCETGFECLAHVCTPEGGSPVPGTDRRSVLDAELIVAGKSGSPVREFGTSFLLEADGATELNLGFTLPQFEAATLDRAFLVLPLSAAPRPMARATLEARGLLDSPSGSRSYLPRTNNSTVFAIARGESSVRFDVTDELRGITQQYGAPRHYFVQITNRAADTTGPGITVELDPKLELYLHVTSLQAVLP